MHFLQFCADCSKKSIKAIYIYASETSRHTFSENSSVYYVVTYCFGDIIVWSWSPLLKFCWVRIFLDILIVKISWMVAQTLINHIIFWKSVMKTFRCIYVNGFNKLSFLAVVGTKLQKMHFFAQFKDHNSGRKHEN